MAEQHVRAVQEYSKIEDDTTRHILEVVALDIGKDDSPAYTSFRKIAQRARCAVGTVQTKIQDAIDSGELIAVKDGKYWFYSINPELIPYGRTVNSAENSGKNQSNRLATVEDIELLYQKLYQGQEGLYQKLYQQIVSVVSTVQTSTDTEVLEKDIINSPTPLSDHFTTVSGCLPNPGTFADDWEQVLDEWQRRYGDKTHEMITRAVKFARGDNQQKRRYTITSPRSIANIMANLEPNGAVNGQVVIGAR
jgi:hypothetical protein